jgi:hypothetical protein
MSISATLYAGSPLGVMKVVAYTVARPALTRHASGPSRPAGASTRGKNTGRPAASTW